MIMHHRLKYCISYNALDYYLFKPSLGQWFYKNWKGYAEDFEKRTCRQWIRMFIEWVWGGYSIYYASRDDSIVGYITVARGGRRITLSSKKDIVLGPYYTLKEMRGQGIASSMIETVLHDLGLKYESAFCYIKKTNVASLKASAKCGFFHASEAEIRGALRKLYPVNSGKGSFYIMKYDKGNEV